jgi:hypothetical protein
MVIKKGGCMKKLLVILALLFIATPLFADDDKIGVYDYNDGYILSVNSDGSVPTTISSGTIDTITNPVEPKPHTTFGTTVITMTGNCATPILVTAQECKRAIVNNPTTSLGDIWVGDSKVNAGCSALSKELGQTDFDYVYEGICLNEGDSLVLNVDNLSDIYINTSTATGQLVTVGWES